MMYFAQPYSHEDEAVRDHRFEIGSYVAARLFIQSYTVFAPIVHWHEAARKHKIPGDFHTWKKYNFAMLERSTDLVVLAISGWTDSQGLIAEVRRANELGLPAYIIRNWHRPELAMTTTTKLLEEIADGEDCDEPGLGHIDIDGDEYRRG
jgi:hypothetical protein